MSVRAAELEIVVTVNTAGAQAQLATLDNQLRTGVGAFMAGRALQGVGGGLIGFFKDSVMAGAKFEQEITFVNRLIGGTIDQIDALKKKAVEVDISTIFNALEVVQGMQQLAREGFSGEAIVGQDGMDGLIDSALDFAAAINEDVVTATNIYGNVLRVFNDQGLTGAETADILTSAILRSGRSASEFATGFQYVGAIANELGVPLKDLAVVMAELTREGIKSRSAGTGLRSMFLALADPAGQASQAIDRLGITAYDLATGEFVGLPSLIEQFGDALDGVSDRDALKLIEDIFGKPAASPLLTLFRQGIEGFNETEASMDSLGSAEAVMEARMDTLAGSIDILSASWFTFKKQLGDSVSGYIKPVIDGLTSLLNIFQRAPGFVHTIIAVLVLLAGAVTFLAGTIMLFTTLGGPAVFAAIASALGAVALPVLAVIGVLVGLGVAYKENLLGFRDAVEEVGQQIADFLQPALDAFDSLIDYVGQVWSTNKHTTKPFGNLEGDLGSITRAAGVVVTGLAQVWDALNPPDKVVGVQYGGKGMPGSIVMPVTEPLEGLERLDYALQRIPHAIDNILHGFGLLGARLSEWALNVGFPKIINFDTGFTIGRLQKTIADKLIQFAGMKVGPFTGWQLMIGAAAMIATGFFLVPLITIAIGLLLADKDVRVKLQKWTLEVGAPSSVEMFTGWAESFGMPKTISDVMNQESGAQLTISDVAWILDLPMPIHILIKDALFYSDLALLISKMLDGKLTITEVKWILELPEPELRIMNALFWPFRIAQKLTGVIAGTLDTVSDTVGLATKWTLHLDVPVIDLPATDTIGEIASTILGGIGPDSFKTVGTAIANGIYDAIKTALKAVVPDNVMDWLTAGQPLAPFEDPRRYEPTQSSQVGTTQGGAAVTTLPTVGTGTATLKAPVTDFTDALAAFTTFRANAANELVGLRGDATVISGGIRNAVANEFVGLRTDVTVIMTSMSDSVLNVLVGLRNNASMLATSIGSAIGEGISAGIASWSQTIADTAAAAVTGAITAARAAAGNPHSPSPVSFQQIGSPLGEGIYAGIRSWQGKTSEAMANLVQVPAHSATQNPRGQWRYADGRSGTPTTFHVDVHMPIQAPVYGVDDLQRAVVSIFTEDVSPALETLLRKAS